MRDLNGGSGGIRTSDKWTYRYTLIWLGYLDSNQGIVESKSTALPTWLYPNCLEASDGIEPSRKGI